MQRLNCVKGSGIIYFHQDKQWLDIYLLICPLELRSLRSTDEKILEIKSTMNIKYIGV